MLAPDTILQNRYRIIRLLGQGGMGAVYEALDLRLDTTVALKETLFADERLRKQFEREARLLARMHHPALPRVSDHFDEGDGQFLVMQFIPGDDLSQMMVRKQGPFPANQVLTWGDQLLDALDYLHTQDPQIIHRDIKPQNLKTTGRGQIILLDFGLAKGQSGGVSLVTTSASIFGYTPNYAPLEQIQGLGTDARSDIYALSATLYHLMTGVKPPDALTRAAALVNGQADPLLPAHEVTGGVGAEVSGVLARAMSQNRDQRYSSAAAMRGALNGIGAAPTLTGNTEAATVIRDRPATTIREPGSEAPTTMKPSESTVVSSKSAPERRRVSPWTIGAVALLSIGMVFGCLYAFQHRNDSDAAATPSAEQGSGNSSAAQPSPGTEQTGNEPSSGALADVKQPDTTGQPANGEPARKAEEPVRKAEKTARKNEKTGNKRPTDDEEKPPDVTQQQSNQVVVPNVPDLQVPEMRPGRRGDLRRLRPTTMTTLPDGRQVMTLPDGTRIVTRTDGSKRVFGPGQRIPQRKN